MKGLAAAAGAVCLGLAACAAFGAAEAPGADWPVYGHDRGGMRYSPLDQINVANVARLTVAWTYHMRPPADRSANVASSTAAGGTRTSAHGNHGSAGVENEAAARAQRAAEGLGFIRRRRSRFRPSEATPLVVNGTLYLGTPYGRVVALEPETGREIWAFTLPGASEPAPRGLAYWPGDATHPAEILFGTRDGLLFALDARTGRPVEGFGRGGIVDLKTPEVMPPQPVATPFGPAGLGMTSPPLVYRDLVITGSVVQEYPERGPSGDVRAWDVRTGKLVWTFHSVPHPGEPGHETWSGDSWKQRSGTNVWGIMTVDAARGIVYLPFGAPTWDRYGGDRHGANLFGTSVVAVDAETGRRLWHFQIVHHDIWDLDAEAPPLLLDAKHGARTIPAVAIVSKSGLFFLLDRITGKPLLPIAERPVPTSDVPGEQAWPTQPFPSKTPPFARQSFSMRDLATVTPQLDAYCRKFIEEHHMRMGGPYLPIGYERPTIDFPGREGGANWGGGAYDPRLGLFFVNANNLGQVEQLKPRGDGTLTNADATTGRFADREHNLMCQKPPWGTLTAISVRTGKIAWQSTLGVSDQLPAAVSRTGRPSVGGPIATAGGLIFIGGTDDARFRAFDSRRGREIWAARLPASAHATPITYLGRDGRQYVAVVSTGGSFLDSPVASDVLTAFALPSRAAATDMPFGYPDAYAGKKKVLVIGDLHTGNQVAHDSVSHAMATLERLGRESGAYVAFLRTDTELVTKGEVWGTGNYAKGGPKQAPGHNLAYFDAVVFYTNGETDMTSRQKHDLLAFIHDDGKGFVGVHTATASLYGWPEYGAMIGGYFDNHPWGVFDAPIIVEQPDFPIMKGLPREFTVRDEIYEYRAPYSRDEVDVLASLDVGKIDLSRKSIHRTDRDFPIAWVKTYGKGRVFSSTLGHSDQSWDDANVQRMYLQAIEWVLRLTDAPVEPHPAMQH